MRPAPFQLAAVFLLFGILVFSAAPRIDATELGAIMMAGAAFFNSNDVDRVAEELNFKSLSPGLDGGVFLQVGSARNGWSGLGGIAVFWARRRHPTEFVSDEGSITESEGAFRLTSLGIPITALYSLSRGRGRFYAGAGVGYYVATVTADSDVTGSNWFPNDGTSSGGTRSADGPGLHLVAGYEHPTPIGGLGAGLLFRHARFPTDDVRGASNFDVDLSGVSLFVSLSVRPSKPDPNQAP